MPDPTVAERDAFFAELDRLTEATSASVPDLMWGPGVRRLVDTMNAVEGILQDDVYPEFAGIQTWDDALQEGANTREAADYMRWHLGDLVNYACPHRKSGRPALPKEGDAVERTLASFAYSIGEDRQTVSQVAANAQFFKKDVRQEIPPNASWRMCAKARGKTGWKMGQPVTEEQVRLALSLVFDLADGAERPERTLLQDAKAVFVAAERLNARPLDREAPLVAVAARRAYNNAKDVYEAVKEAEEAEDDQD